MRPKRYELKLDGESLSHFLGCIPSIQGLVLNVADMADMRVINVTTSEICGPRELGEGFVDVGGVSCLALISTSHISIHTWPKLKHVMFDLVSCKPFNQMAIRDYVIDNLRMVGLLSN